MVDIVGEQRPREAKMEEILWLLTEFKRDKESQSQHLPFSYSQEAWPPFDSHVWMITQHKCTTTPFFPWTSLSRFLTFANKWFPAKTIFTTKKFRYEMHDAPSVTQPWTSNTTLPVAEDVLLEFPRHTQKVFLLPLTMPITQWWLENGLPVTRFLNSQQWFAVDFQLLIYFLEKI